MRDAGAMRGLPDATAGLPRRCAPRNDNAKTWGMPKRSLDCRVATLLAMTKGRTGMGEMMRVPFFGCVPQRCHCEPVRAWQSGLRRCLR